MTIWSRVGVMVIALVAALVVPAVPPAEATVAVSGTVSTPTGSVHNGGFSLSGGGYHYAAIATDGTFSVQAPAGTYTAAATGALAPGNSPRTSFRIERAGVAVGAGTTLDLSMPALEITLRVTDTSGAEVTASTAVECNAAIDGTDYHLRSETTGTGSVAHWGIPGSTCTVTTVKANSLPQTTAIDVPASGGEIFEVVVPVTHRLTGTLSGGPGSRTQVMDAFDSDGLFAASASFPVPRDFTRYALDLQPDETYDIFFQFFRDDDGLEGTEKRWARGVQVDADREQDFTFPTRPLALHFVDRAGNAVSTYFNHQCSRTLGFDHRWEPDQTGYPAIELVNTSTAVRSVATATVHQPLDDGGAHPWHCSIAVPRVGFPSWPKVPVDYVEGDDLTFVVPAGVAVAGTPDAEPGDDGVSDLVEALGPNGGDANHDGVPDHEQAHVTSLPAKGAAPGEGVAYVSLVGPPTSTFRDVSTLDPDTLPTPPPEGTVLPTGLASFVLDDVDPGSTVKVTFYVESTEGVNGYAKYDPSATPPWSTLPSERVKVFEDRVEVSLTDGGEGDADHAPDGRITDPGGLAQLPVAADTVAPVVTGSVISSPNAAGWYDDDVRIRWTATDVDSEVAEQPVETVVTTEGRDVTGESPLVCDTAPTPNCTRGQVTGLKIDKTVPELSLGGVRDGETYTLGVVPEARCSASDEVSGVDGECRIVVDGGNANGVGGFTYRAEAVDLAGNRRVEEGEYSVVYRFDGFLPPVNDATATPGVATSVFKAGKTIPVRLTLRNASGQVVQPTSKPVWVAPRQLGSTTLPVNTQTSSAKNDLHDHFEWRSGAWEHNWSTKGVTGGYLYRVSVRLDDGTTHDVTVGLR